MSLECFASVVERQKPTANGFNKPKQKISCQVRSFETAIERGCGKRCP